MDANIIKNEKQENDNKGEDNRPKQEQFMKRKKINGTKVKDVQRIQMNDYLTKVVNENDVCDSFEECNQPIYVKIPKI
jgi:hypothetical protein